MFETRSPECRRVPTRAVLLFGMLPILATSAASSGQEPLHQAIDAAIASKAGGSVAESASDAEFLRRVTLDLAGTIPTSEEVRRFLDDKTADKRARMIDRLLASDRYPLRMQQALTVMLLERRAGRFVSDEDWNEFLRSSFAANKPWDRFVRELVLADGGDEKSRASVRFFVDGGRNEHNLMTQDVARLFLGMDIMCAQCHDHPTIDDYKQAHYFGLYAYLSQSRLHNNSKTKRPFLAETPAKSKIEFQSVFFPEDKKSTGPRLPGGKEIDVPVFEKGQEIATPAADGLPAIPKFRPRVLLAGDLTSATNRQFARNAVNRFWFLMMGRGLVHPLDLDHSGNPPSHPELLDRLTTDFVAHKFDVKWLLREIALSNSYQRSSLLPEGVDAKEAPPESYRVANAKPLSAEQLTFALLQATGHLQRLEKAPIPEKSEFTVKDYINGRIEPPSNLPDALKLVAGIFGRPPGEAEVEFAPSMGQALFLMNEKLVLAWLKPNDGNLIDTLARTKTTEQTAEELYLGVLSRKPDGEEQAEVAAYLEKHSGRRIEALGELAWALLASAEFRLNH